MLLYCKFHCIGRVVVVTVVVVNIGAVCSRCSVGGGAADGNYCINGAQI